MAKKKPTYDQPETVATFTLLGRTHRIIIFFRGAAWHASYQRSADAPASVVVAGLEAPSRRALMRAIKQFMTVHGSCLMSNLIGDSEAEGIN